MEGFPFQDSLYVAMHHGSSGWRSHCVIFSRRWSYFKIFFEMYLPFDKLLCEQKKKIWFMLLKVPRWLSCTYCEGKLDFWNNIM
jgi:hypothetical protein